MPIALIVAVALTVLVATFSVQNAQPVQVTFLKWYFEAPQVVVLLLTFAAGLVAGCLALVPSRFRKMRELGRCQARVRELEEARPKEPEPLPSGETLTEEKLQS